MRTRVEGRLANNELGRPTKIMARLFDEAIQILNWRILPALKFSPKELLLSLIVTHTTPIEVSRSMPTARL